MHGPQLESGFTFSGVAGVPAGPRYNSGDEGNQPFLFPPVGASGGYSFVPDSGGVPFRIGLHVPVPAVVLAQADLNVQLRGASGASLDAGAGVNLSVNQVMPYVQLGDIDEEGTGWYTTQGVTLMRPASYATNLLWGWMWLPTAAYQWSWPGRTLHAFATAGIGEETGSCASYCPDAERRYVLSGGVIYEFNTRR
jgi:hypothetical protein